MRIKKEIEMTHLVDMKITLKQYITRVNDNFGVQFLIKRKKKLKHFLI